MISEEGSPFSRSLPSSLEIAAVVAILLLALVLRMGWPGLTEFKADEARLLALSLQMAGGEAFPLRGISSSVGFPNFPTSVWLYALPLFLWQHVYSATLFTGLVNVLGVAACWWLVRRYWGPVAALAALLLFAVNPWAVMHARKIWAQNLLPPLVVGWGIGALLTFVERRPRFIILHLLFLAVAVQVHFAAVALIPTTVLFLIIFRQRLSRGSLLLGSLVALLTVLPFAYYLLQQADVGVGAGLSALLESGDGTARDGLSARSWRHLLLLSTGRELHSLAGPAQFEAYLASIPPMAPVHMVWAGLVAGGALWFAWRSFDRMRTQRQSWFSESSAGRRRAEAGFIVLVWLLLPPLFFTWFPVDVMLHYLLPAYPAPFIAAGVAFALLLGWRNRWRRPAWLVLALTAGLQLWALGALLNLLAVQATPGGFGTPLAMKLAGVAEVQQLQRESGAEEVLIAGPGEDTEVDAFAAVYDVLLRDLPHRFVNVTRSALFPDGPAVVLLAPEVEGGAVPIYLEAASARRSLPLRRGEGRLQLLALPGGSMPEPAVWLEPTHLFASWMDLYGYDAAVQERTAQLAWNLYWHPGANPDPADYHFFNHLLDAQGERVAQEDAAVFSPSQWQAGDAVISHFLLSLPPDSEGPLRMRTGVYRYPELENVPLLDVAGNPYADAVEVEIDDWRLGIRD